MITRAEAAVIIGRIYTDNVNNGNTTNFTDSSEFELWAKEYINKTAAMGIVKGYEDGSFKPRNNITRAEAAVMIFRAKNMLKRE